MVDSCQDNLERLGIPTGQSAVSLDFRWTLSWLGLDFQVFVSRSSSCHCLPLPNPPLSSLCWLTQPGDASGQMQPGSLSYLESPSQTIPAFMFQQREEKQGEGTEGTEDSKGMLSSPLPTLNLACGFPRFSPFSASLADRMKISWV